MASLENKKIKDTYEGLLKTDDNAAIDGAVEITDGAGNGTGVTISNDGQVTATGTVSFGSLKNTGEDITVTKFVDEADGIGNNDNDTSIPTSAAVKDYVDTNVTAQDLDFQGDTGTGAVDLDSQSLDIAGGTGIDTAASGQTLTVNIDSTVATLSDTQTLTNKTVDADNNTVSNLEVDNLKSGVLDTDLTSVSASDDTLASAKAIKTYVDSNITAQDLDITDGTTTSAVDLDSQTLTIEGTANEVEVSLTDQTFTVGLPTSITTNVTGNLTGNVTGNVTGDVTGNADTASALETARTISLSGDVAGSVSFDGSANADITATIQANSVALGTDTTGDYVENLGTGTGVTIGSNTGEGSNPTISVDYGSTANTAVQGNTSLTIQGTANEIEVTGGGVTLGSGGTVTVGLPNDVSLGGSLTIAQNLTVNGTTTTVNTDTLSVEDPLIELARDNSENSVDVGLYGKYSLDSGVTTKYSGLFKDASDSDKFKLFKGLEVEPTSTVDTSGTGYTKGDLVINDLDAVTLSGNLTGDVTGDLTGSVLTAAQTNITSVGTLSSLTVSGDLTVDTNTLKVDSTNNRVGIGTSSPSATLELNSATSNEAVLKIGRSTNPALPNNLQLGTSGGDSVITAVGTSSVNGSLIFQRGTTSANTESLRIDSSGDIKFNLDSITDTRSLNFPYYNASNAKTEIKTTATGDYRQHFDILMNTAQSDSAPTSVFRIQNNGNVGIGTTSPTAKTDIRTSASSGATNEPTFRAFGYDTDSYFEVNNNANNSANIKLTRSDAATMFSIDGHSGTTFLNGNVGIGTTSPRTKLHISGLTGDDDPSLGTSTAPLFVSNTANSYGLNVGVNNLGDAWLQAQSNTSATAYDILLNPLGGNVGIGTTSPDTILEVVDENPILTVRDTSTGLSSANAALRLAESGSGDTLDNYWDLKMKPESVGGTTNFAIANSSLGEVLNINYQGNVGIGTSSASNGKLQIDSTGNQISIETGTSGDGRLHIGHFSNGTFIGTYGDDGGAADIIRFGTHSGDERMRITSGGAVLIGTTDADPIDSNSSGVSLSNSFRRFHSTTSEATLSVGTSSANLQYFFYNSGTTLSVVGTITTNGSSTAYNTSSDYRLKENVVDLTGALDRVDQLEPKRFNFIADQDTTVDGFLAHEVQDIVPEAVTGEKDAVDEDGNDIYQGIDQSKLVPLLVGAIKELRAEVNSLKAQINN